jgi:hypothetical protein
MELSQLIDSNKPLVYFDESSFNMWMHSTRTWMNSNDPVRILLNKSRGENVTVYGAIGNCLPKALFLQTKVTNEKATIQFV